MTNREFYNAIVTANLSDEITEKAQALLAQIDARNEKRASTPSKTAIANVPLKHAIVGLFTDEVKTLTASEVGERLEVSTQKASALLRQMVESGVLAVEEVKIPKKGKVKAYSLVG
jgi:Fic family protein